MALVSRLFLSQINLKIRRLIAMKRRIFARISAVFLITAVLSSCSQDSKTVYVAIATNSHEEVTLAQNFLKKMSSNLGSSDRINLDLLRGETV